MKGKSDIGFLQKQLLDDYSNSLNHRKSKITAKKCKKIAKFILSQETDFNLPETKYSLLLHFVLQNGDKTTFKLVLKKGKNIDVNAQDLNKRTILYYALYKNETENKEAFIKLLFDYGALIDVGEEQDKLQTMVTKYALKETLLLKKNAVPLDLLIRRGFDINSRGDIDNRPFLKLFEKSKCDDNRAWSASESDYPYGDYENNTDMYFHQRPSAVKMIELLVDNVVDTDATNNEECTGGVETDDQQRLRFQVELEFVQCLANPNYLNFLAQRNHLKDPNFINYLKYLLYWKEPEYAKYLKYPMCLYFLDLLQHEHFRREVVNSQCTKFIDDQQILLWQHYTRRRTRLLQTAAEQTQNAPPQNNGIIQPKVL